MSATLASAFRCTALLSLSLSLVTSAHAQSTPQTAPSKTWTDPGSPVSFEYPSVWIHSRQNTMPFPPAIAAAGEPLEAVVAFSPRGNYYAATNLTGLQFAFRKVARPAAADCPPLVSGADRQSRPEIIHGLQFTHIVAGDAAMSKSVDQQVYVTFLKGTCYLFEEDLGEIGVGVVDGQRALTAKEQAALHRHLAAIMDSVRIRP